MGLAHAFGVALLVRPPPPEDVQAATYESTLQNIFAVCRGLPMHAIRVRFQLISALQCWWCAAGAHASLQALRRAWQVLAASHGGALPNAIESTEGQAWVSTKDHKEVAQALTPEVATRMKMEEYAFPFWIDIVLSPACMALSEMRVSEEEHWD